MIAFVIGGALCVHDDLVKARQLCNPDFIVIVNDFGVEYSDHIDHWVSFHPDLLEQWVDERQLTGLKPAGKLWIGISKPKHIKINAEELIVKGGSSGFLGTMVALHQEATKIILCGIPMDINMAHFNSKHRGRPWTSGRGYRKTWVQNKDLLQDKVKSFTGYTKELLGEPTEEWLVKQ